MQDHEPSNVLAAKARERIERIERAKQGPSYFELTNLRMEAAARLARALQTLKAADVIGQPQDNCTHPKSLAEQAIDVARTHWSAICSGITPINAFNKERSFAHDKPACIEAFRVVVLEYGMRESLKQQCQRIADDSVFGFDCLIAQTLPAIQHTCQEGCACGSITE